MRETGLQHALMDTIHAGKHGVAGFLTMYAVCSHADKGFSSIGTCSQAKLLCSDESRKTGTACNGFKAGQLGRSTELLTCAAH